jgi:hypothetical protein
MNTHTATRLEKTGSGLRFLLNPGNNPQPLPNIPETKQTS